MAVLCDGRYFVIFGHSQPFSQSLQQSQSQLQFGQSLQHSFEQQAPFVQHDAVPVVPVVADEPATPAAMSPAANTRPPNNFTNMENSLSG
jgi:hypothetical protein